MHNVYIDIYLVIYYYIALCIQTNTLRKLLTEK